MSASATQASPRLLDLQSERVARAENLRRGLRRFRRNPLAVTGLVILVAIALAALLGPYIAPHPGDATGEIHIEDSFLRPSWAHPFGTDDVGDDIFSRVMIGGRLSLGVGLMVVVVAVLIGVPLGAAAGFFGGFVDEFIMRVTDVFLTVPGIVLALAIAAALGASLVNAMFALAIVWWPGYCRLVQAQVMALREQAYVEAARSIGVGQGRLIMRHILPNTMTPVMVKVSMDIGFAILSAAGLSFIGVGAQPPQPEWGAMVSIGRQYLPDYWWYSTFPGIAIFLVVFAANMLGDGLRDLLDPRGRIS